MNECQRAYHHHYYYRFNYSGKHILDKYRKGRLFFCLPNFPPRTTTATFLAVALRAFVVFKFGVGIVLALLELTQHVLRVIGSLRFAISLGLRLPRLPTQLRQRIVVGNVVSGRTTAAGLSYGIHRVPRHAETESEQRRRHGRVFQFGFRRYLEGGDFVAAS